MPICDSCQKLVHLSRREGGNNIQGKLHQTFDHFLEWSVVSHHCSNILGYSVVVEVWSLNSGHTTVTLKISPGMVFLVFQVTNSPVTVNLLSKGHHAMDQYSKYSMDILYSLLFVGTWYRQNFEQSPQNSTQNNL